VLRKKPAGELLTKTAHQVEREFTVLKALHDYNSRGSTPADKRVPIPTPIILCEDTSVIGTPFYIMEFLDGRIFTDVRMPEIPAHTRREWQVLWGFEIIFKRLIASQAGMQRLKRLQGSLLLILLQWGFPILVPRPLTFLVK
jgi:hypothetical protein